MKLAHIAVPLLAAAVTLGATPPLDVAAIAHATSSVANRTLTTIDGKTIALRHPDRPTVLVMFASWCVGCIDELPRVLADYRRFKDRADFIGIDYLDDSTGMKTITKRFAIPFPVIRAHPATPPSFAPPSASHTVAAIQFHGMKAKELTGAAIEQLQSAVSKETLAKLRDLAAHCETLDENACDAYARSKDLSFDAPGSKNVVQLDPRAPSTPDAKSTDSLLNLPYLIVLDANGIVRDSEEGYNTGTDPIVNTLAKLGIK